MDTKPLLGIGCLLIVGMGIMTVLLFGVMAMGLGGDDEGIDTALLAQAGTGIGSVSNAVPAALAEIFVEAGNAIQTPPALLAATSQVECNPLWAFARKSPDKVRDWIRANTKVDSNGCASPNSAGAAGPMQFLQPTFDSYAPKAEAFTGRSGSSRLVIKDAVYAAAIMLKENSEREGKSDGVCQDNPANTKASLNDWDENAVCWAAHRYHGNCSLSYCEKILKFYRQYKGADNSKLADGNTGSNGVPLFHQADPRWGKINYGSSGTIGSSGCAPTALAMVMKFYGHDVTPETMSAYSARVGCRVDGQGTSHRLFPLVAEEFGFKLVANPDWDAAMDHLKQGRPVLASGRGPTPYTSSGHFIVLTGYNQDGTISVNDPNQKSGDYQQSHLRQYNTSLFVLYK